MDRVTIKENAKKMIKDNLWYLWKPMVWLFVICFAIGFAFGLLDAVCDANGAVSSIASFITGIISAIFTVGYAYYCLAFVRGQRMEAKEVLNFAKEHWLIALLTYIVVDLNIVIGMILLIIPGLMAAMGLSLYAYVVADDPTLSTMEALKKAWDITNGHKMDLFVFFLSFLGWIILMPFTLFILAIWLVPYMTIAEVLVYESFKK